jgi:prolipoprotein diacylglyceryl transferase
MFRHEGAPEKWIGSLFIYVVIAMVVGARLGHVFFYDWEYYSHHLMDIFKIWEGGLASHGGTIGLLIAILLYSHYVTHKSPLWTFDRLVVPTAFVAGLIRLGNLMNHEIYGSVTTMPWGFRFVDNLGAWMHGSAPVFTQPCHPTQIYEALCYFALFGLMMWMYWRKNSERRPGLLFGVAMLGIFTARFFIEFIKNVQEPWEIGLRNSCGMDIGQILSIPFIILGICLIIYAYRKPPLEMTFPNKFPESGNSKK